MEWTHETPTAQGYYWLRGCGLFLVKVYQGPLDDELRAQYHGTYFEDVVANIAGVAWYGPIEPPEH